MLLVLSGSAAAVRTTATHCGGHRGGHRTTSQSQAVVREIGDLKVAASEPELRLTRRRRRQRRRADEHVTSTSSIVLAPSASSLLPPAHSPLLPPSPPGSEANPLLNPAVLWEIIEPHTGHLADEDRTHLRASIDVLIAKVTAALVWQPSSAQPSRPAHPVSRGRRHHPHAQRVVPASCAQPASVPPAPVRRSRRPPPSSPSPPRPGPLPSCGR